MCPSRCPYQLAQLPPRRCHTLLQYNWIRRCQRCRPREGLPPRSSIRLLPRPSLAPHACGKKTLHVSLWVRIPSIAIAAVTLMSEIPSIAIAAVTSMWNFIFSASEYVPAKSSYTSVGVPLISPTPWPIACLSLLFISMSPSCMEHAALTGLSPTRVPRSSCPFFGFPVPPLLCLGTEIFCCFWFPLLDYFPFFDMIFVAQPRHAFACARGKGKTGVTVTVTRLSLGCLILFLPLI